MARITVERCLLAAALWFIFWSQAVQLAFAQGSPAAVASPSAALDAFSDGAAPQADAFADANHPAYVGVCNTPGPVYTFSNPNCSFGPAPAPPQTDLDIRSSAAKCAQLYGKNSAVDVSVPDTFKFNLPQQALQTIDWCGAFEAQLLAAGYAAIRDQTDSKLVRILPIAQTTSN
jgi:hypothetical protein